VSSGKRERVVGQSAVIIGASSGIGAGLAKFTPQGADSTPCVGVTNDQGLYVMYLKPGMKGIPKGIYGVSIALPGDEGTSNVMLPPVLAGITIPKEYRTGSSTLTCDVPRSGTVFDIDITTK